MLAPALADPDPVVIFEHAQLYNLEDELPDDWRCDIAPPATVRAGAAGGKRVRLRWLPPQGAAGGGKNWRPRASRSRWSICALRPLDIDTVAASVRRTHRAVVVDEGWRSGSPAAELIARIVDPLLGPRRAAHGVCSEEVPIPYAKHLEEAAFLPSGAEDRRAVKELLNV